MANPIKIKCTISSVIKNDDAVFTITLKPSRRLPNFQPGQFLHLALDPFDPTIGFWPESRVFSIASTPNDLELTIAYAVKGSFTKQMRQELTIGRDVWVRLPYGHFSLAAAPNEEIILVAGGTGITPFISFILNEMRRPTGLSLKLVYGVRKPEHFLFSDILTRALSRLKGFKLLVFCESGYHNIGEFLVSEGSLSLNMIFQAPDDPLKSTFYISGPTAMINNFKTGLLDRGINPEKIRIDEWE